MSQRRYIYVDPASQIHQPDQSDVESLDGSEQCAFAWLRPCFMPIYYCMHPEAKPINLDNLDQTYIAEPIFGNLPMPEPHSQEEDVIHILIEQRPLRLMSTVFPGRIPEAEANNQPVKDQEVEEDITQKDEDKHIKYVIHNGVGDPQQYRWFKRVVGWA